MQHSSAQLSTAWCPFRLMVMWVGDLWVFKGLRVRVTSPSDLTVITAVCVTHILVCLLPRTDPLRQLSKVVVFFFFYTITPLDNPLLSTA